MSIMMLSSPLQHPREGKTDKKKQGTIEAPGPKKSPLLSIKRQMLYSGAMHVKTTEMGKLGRLVVSFALTACIILSSLPASAATADVDVTITVGQIVQVEYTGDPTIYFDIDQNDINEGSEGQVNLGDINWWSNVPTWEILIERTYWDTNDGDPNLEFHLQVKYGPPDNDNWVTVPVVTYPDPPAVWIEGSGVGTGTYEGIDWKIKDLTWDMQPGTYWCTVTISIVAAE